MYCRGQVVAYLVTVVVILCQWLSCDGNENLYVHMTLEDAKSLSAAKPDLP